MNTEFQKIYDFFQNDIFATQITGIELVDAHNNYAKCSLSIEEKHLNAAGAVMGGVIFTLADFAFAVAANFNQPLTVTLASHINFLNTPKGKILTATANSVRDGKNTCFMYIEIKDELETLVATVNSNGYRK